MILLYTGAASPDQPQVQADKSIGGFISSTPVINGAIGNIFPLITNSSTKQTRMIALKNTTGAQVQGVRIWTETSPNAFSNLLIGAVAPGFDSKCNRFFFEQLSSPESLPFQATVQSHESEVNSLSIGSLDPDKFIGIWIVRDLNSPPPTPTTTTPPNTYNMWGKCTDQEINQLEQNLLSNSIAVDDIKLIIDWL